MKAAANNSLNVANKTLDVEEAKDLLAGFCFETYEQQWRAPALLGPSALIDLPPHQTVPRRAYRLYDCSKRDGSTLQVDDVAGPALLNVPNFTSATMTRLLMAAPLIDAAVAKVPGTFVFWELDAADVMPSPGAPPAGSPSFWLHRAWFVAESVHGAGPTVTHKVLHRRWPRLFPLLDDDTARAYGGWEGSWVKIVTDLQSQKPIFDSLELWFASSASLFGGIPLTRLRILDIVLWCLVRGGRRSEVQGAGKKIRSLFQF